MDHVLKSFCSSEKIGGDCPEQGPCTEWPQFVRAAGVPVPRALFPGVVMDFDALTTFTLC